MGMKKADPVPPGFNVSLWVNGDHPLEPFSPFDKDAVGIIPDIPTMRMSCSCWSYFITDEVVEDITYQTNLYSEQFFSANMDKLSNVSGMRRFVGGTSVDHMKVFNLTILYGHREETRCKGLLKLMADNVGKNHILFMDN